MTEMKEIKRTTPALNKHKIKQKSADILFAIFRYTFLVSISYIILYPLFAMVAYGIQSHADVLDTSVNWISRDPTIKNFKDAWAALEYPTALFNTVFVGGISALLEIFSCAIAAYGFARFKFRGRNFLFGLVLLTAIVPVQVLVIPLFLNFKYFDFGGLLTLFYNITGQEGTYLDLTNTGFTFWLPSLFGVGLRSGLFIFIYRQFFTGLPKELEEASWIDGCGPLMTFFRVVIPSSGVVFLTVSIFAIIWHWNEYYQSVIFMTSDFPLSVKLSGLSTTFTTLGISNVYQGGPTAAACLLFIAPMLIMFLFLQKKFIQSIDRVGIVG